MKNLTLGGDPQTLDVELARLLHDNPQMKIVAMAASSMAVPNPKPIQVTGNPFGNLVQTHILYIIYDGPDAVDSTGKTIRP